MTAQEKLNIAHQRLHHLSMRYFGAFVECGQGKPIGMVPLSWPGRKEIRDLVDLVLLTRAEISGLSRILVDAGIVTPARLTAIMTEEYEFITKAKEKQLAVKVTDHGLEFKVGGE